MTTSNDRAGMTDLLRAHGACGAILGAPPHQRACILPLGHGPHGDEGRALDCDVDRIAEHARMRVALETILWHASGDCPHTVDEHMACFSIIERIAKLARVPDDPSSPISSLEGTSR